MQTEATRTGMSMTGVAVLAACACGTSSGIGRLTGSFGAPAATGTIHPLFVAVAGIFIVTGLWRLGNSVRALALLGMTLLMAAEFITPPMSIAGKTNLSVIQLGGLAVSMLAAVALVAAFFRAYPSRQPSAALTAMSGTAMASGCNCCLVTMGITGTLHSMFPNTNLVAQTSTVYIAAGLLMAIGLFRLRGAVPALMALAGQGFLYYWLELPYFSMPAVNVNGVNINFVIKYPMMVVGGLVVMAAFAYAWRTQEETAATAGYRTPAFGD